MSEESSELVATGREERSLRSCTTGFALINPDTIFLFFFSSRLFLPLRQSVHAELLLLLRQKQQDDRFHKTEDLQTERLPLFRTTRVNSPCVSVRSHKNLWQSHTKDQKREREDCCSLSTIPASSQKERGKRATPSDNNEA